MKHIQNFSKFLFVIALFVFQACSNDDESINPTGEQKTYTLNSVAVDGINGNVTFAENDDGSTTITIQLSNTPAGGEHPAHIHANTAAEGGDIHVTLDPVNGDNGQSVTTISTLNDGTTITYQELLNYDGYINVHLSSSDLATIVAQGDIGQNELTQNSTTYNLGSVAVPTISGTATFIERVNGFTLVELMVDNTPAGGEHPAHIHFNTAAEGGGIAVSLTSVNGDNGMSKTNVEALDGGTAITYDELVDYNGYINVHLSASDLATIVAQGDIGQNALTGMTTSYPLSEVAIAGISGTATFAERNNGTTLVTIEIIGTPTGGDHPAHIHENSASEGGGIAISLTNVNGDTGMSKTQVAALNSGTAITYTELIAYDGYINVHASADDLATLAAQGDIGSNAN